VGMSYAGMPYAEAERNLRCFVKHVMPAVKKWDTQPLNEPRELEVRAQAASAS